MKRVSIQLSLKIVAPLVDVIREAAASLKHELAAPSKATDTDTEFQSAWKQELLAGQNKEVRALLRLFEGDFPSTGIISYDDESAEALVRAAVAVRLRLRERFLATIPDEKLETGEVELPKLVEPVRRAFVCYLFLATLQELIIKDLDPTILDT